MIKNFIQIVCLVVLMTMSHMVSAAVDVNDFSIQHLTNTEGLCSQQIYSIKQTSDGAIWWASKNCVERYNGVSIKCHSLDTPVDASYLAGHLWRLYLSDSGELYAFDNKGAIFKYDCGSDMFVLEMDLRNVFGSELILNDICFDGDYLYVAAGHGAFKVMGNEITPIDQGSTANSIVSVGQNIYFCTSDGVKGTNFQSLCDGNIVSAYYDERNNNLWLGCFSDGVKVISFAKNGKVASVSDVRSTGMPIRNPVRSIYAYDEHTVLLGVDGAGVFQSDRVLSRNHSASLLFDANNGRNGVLGGNGVYAVLCDVWGGIIVGSYSGGIDIAHPIGMTSKIFRHQHNNLQTIINDHVNSVVQLSDGSLVMGTDNGVSIYDGENNKWVHSECGYVVIDLCLLKDGTLLAATYGRGVLKIYSDGRVQQCYSVGNGVLMDDYVFCICEDRDKGLWIGCLDGQLTYLKDGGVKRFNIHNVKDIIQLPDGRMSVGTASGIFLINPSDGDVEALNYVMPDGGEVNRYVCTLYLHGEDELWIGTDGGGVYVYNLSSAQVTRNISLADGLPSSTIASICKDVYNRIMIATDAGLAYVDSELSDKVVDVNYGFNIDREYAVGAVANLQDGQILYGTTTGALIINPDSLKELDYKATLNLSGLDGNDIRLKYSDRTFDLNFECINLSNQDDIAYCYKLDDGQWSEPTMVSYVQFLNMAPGNYVLTLRSVSSSCGTVLDEKTVAIHVDYPWWNSWWMWGVYVLLILVAFYVCWYFYKLHTQYMHLVVNTPTIFARPASKSRSKAAPSKSEKTDVDEGKDFVQKATNLIMASISDPSFNIEKLCREMAMSRTMFYLKLKTYTGKSPQDFIRIIRLERAAALLRTGSSVVEAAEMTGFDNPKYFSTVFKKYFGVSPSKCRKS